MNDAEDVTIARSHKPQLAQDPGPGGWAWVRPLGQSGLQYETMSIYIISSLLYLNNN